MARTLGGRSQSSRRRGRINATPVMALREAAVLHAVFWIYLLAGAAGFYWIELTHRRPLQRECHSRFFFFFFLVSKNLLRFQNRAPCAALFWFSTSTDLFLVGIQLSFKTWKKNNNRNWPTKSISVKLTSQSVLPFCDYLWTDKGDAWLVKISATLLRSPCNRLEWIPFHFQLDEPKKKILETKKKTKPGEWRWNPPTRWNWVESGFERNEKKNKPTKIRQRDRAATENPVNNTGKKLGKTRIPWHTEQSDTSRRLLLNAAILNGDGSLPPLAVSIYARKKGDKKPCSMTLRMALDVPDRFASASSFRAGTLRPDDKKSLARSGFWMCDKIIRLGLGWRSL